MISDQNHGYVVIVNSDGTVASSWAIGGNPYGIALDDDDHVYVAQWGENTLTKYQLPASLGVAGPPA